MIGILGKLTIGAAFLFSVLSLIYYGLASKKNEPSKQEKLGHLFYSLKTVFVLIASGLLMHLLVTHQFNYFYVYNYTSKDLAFKYLVSAFYGGQEGSFLFWILLSGFIGLGLIRWTSDTYRSSVLFVMSLTQFFLLSMLLGIGIGDITIGADRKSVV